MKKYFTWQYIKSPSGHRLLLIIALAGLVLWYIFRKVPQDTSKDALIEQMRKDNAAKDSAINSTNAAIGMLGVQVEHLQKSYDKKGNEIIRIYERVEKDVHHYDTASREGLQRFFDGYTSPSDTAH